MVVVAVAADVGGDDGADGVVERHVTPKGAERFWRKKNVTLFHSNECSQAKFRDVNEEEDII